MESLKHCFELSRKLPRLTSTFIGRLTRRCVSQGTIVGLRSFRIREEVRKFGASGLRGEVQIVVLVSKEHSSGLRRRGKFTKHVNAKSLLPLATKQ